MTDLMGIIATTPLRGKSRENPYIQGYGWVPGVLEDPGNGLSPFRAFPLRAPTPGPLILRKEPDPENTEKQLFFDHFLTASFRTPFPSRRF